MSEENVYPSWRYHKTEPAQIVYSLEEDNALGTEWADTPAAFYTEAQKAIVNRKPRVIPKPIQEDPPSTPGFGDASELEAQREKLLRENEALKKKGKI